MKFFLILIFTFTLSNCAFFNSFSTSSQSLDSISTSLNSVSTGLKSVSSLSNSLASISGSSFSDEKEKEEAESLFRNDMKMTTYLSIRYGSENFVRQIETVSMEHGIIDWTRNKNSFLAIGAGLAKAGLGQSDLQTFLSDLSISSERMNWIREGFLKD